MAGAPPFPTRLTSVVVFQYGEDAVKENGMGGGGGGMADIFDMFAGGGPRRKQEIKGDDILHKLQVKLEDLYKGTTRYEYSVVTRLRTPLCSVFAGFAYLLHRTRAVRRVHRDPPNESLLGPVATWFSEYTLPLGRALSRGNGAALGSDLSVAMLFTGSWL